MINTIQLSRLISKKLPVIRFFSSASPDSFVATKSIRNNTSSSSAPKFTNVSESVQLTQSNVVAGSGEGRIGLTDRAANKVVKIAKSTGKESILRLGITSGGCSGFQYEFAIVNEYNSDDDYVTEYPNGAKLVIEKSLADMFVSDAKVDYVDEMIRSAFAVTQNDAAASGCSCGKSFDPKI